MSVESSTLQEAALLDALVGDPEKMDLVAAILKPVMFGDVALGRMYEGIEALDESSRTIDRRNLLEWLNANSRPKDPDWSREVPSVLTGDVPSHDIEQRAQTVLEHFRLRKIQEICEKNWKRAQRSSAVDAPRLLEALQAELYDLETPGDSGISEKPVDQVASEVAADISRRIDLPEDQRLPGIQSGYAALDRMIGGWAPQNTTVIKGQPGGGKSALALNLALRCAERQEKTVLIFSLEMPDLIVGQRLIAATGSIDARAIRHADMGYDETLKFHDAVARIRMIGKRCYVVDCPSLSPASFRRICRRHGRRKPGLGLVVVDYLQLMDSEESSPTRAEEVSKSARAITSVARENGAHVIVLSQTNEKGATKESRKPQEDASLVATIEPAEGADVEAERVLYDLVIEKNRHGPVAKKGAFRWLFFKKFQRFETVDPRYAGAMEDWQ